MPVGHNLSGPAPGPEDMTVTGIPPDIHLHEAIHNIPSRVDRILQDRSIAANQVTPELVSSLLNQNYVQIRTLFENNSEVQEPVEHSSGTRLHTWGGQLRLLPADYSLPKVNGRIIWQHWWCGDSNSGTPPLKSVSSRSFPPNERKRFSDYLTVKRSSFSDAIEKPKLINN